MIGPLANLETDHLERLLLIQAVSRVNPEVVNCGAQKMLICL